MILLEEEIRSRDLFRERLGIENVEELTEEEIAGVIYQYLAEQEAQIKSREKATDIVEDITGKRITNYILDSIILVFLSAVIGIPWNFNEDELEGLFIIILLLYYIIFEGITGRTIAKYVTNTRVVTRDGRQPSFLNIVGRSLCRLIPFDTLSFLWNGNWHDRISGTKVVINNHVPVVE